MAFGKPAHEERFQRLARRIQELRLKDEEAQQRRARIAEQRSEAVRRLWELCHTFSEHLNTYIRHDRVELTPVEPPEEVPEDVPVQLLLNVRGRVLLLDVRAPANLISTENFKKPYILEGEVRFFSQELLEDERVEEHDIFFCPDEGKSGAWLYFNGHNYKSGPVEELYLAGLMERIL